MKLAVGENMSKKVDHKTYDRFEHVECSSD